MKMTTTNTTTSSNDNDEMVLVNVRSWLKVKHPKQLLILEKFETELATTNHGRRSSSSTSKTSSPKSDVRIHYALKTIELFKIMIGSTKWQTPAQLITLLKSLGRELDVIVSHREPIIGNTVRRILAAVREEVVVVGSTNGDDVEGGGGSSGTNLRSSDPFESILWSLPQQVKSTGRSGGGGGSSASLPPSSSASSSDPAHTSSRHRSGSTSGSIKDAIVIADESSSSSSTNLNNLPSIFYEPSRPDLKQSIMEAIQEITSDVEDVYRNICQVSSNHIHSGEIILTYGRSHTVQEFLREAASAGVGGIDGGHNNSNRNNNKLQFSVIVVDNGENDADGPDGQEQDLASSLAEVGIDTVIIPMASVCAIMARVNKVILPAHSVLANGGLVATSGSNLVVLAAQKNAVPVVVLTGIFKLTPVFPHEQQNTLNDMLSPSSVMDYIAYQQGPPSPPSIDNHQQDSTASNSTNDVDLINPLHDYIQPNLINLYVTNVGSFQPSYIYRLLGEYFHIDDWGSF